MDEHSEQLHLIVSHINDKGIEDEEEEFPDCPFSDVDKFLLFDQGLGANDKQKLVRTLALNCMCCLRYCKRIIHL